MGCMQAFEVSRCLSRLLYRSASFLIQKIHGVLQVGKEDAQGAMMEWHLVANHTWTTAPTPWDVPAKSHQAWREEAPPPAMSVVPNQCCAAMRCRLWGQQASYHEVGRTLGKEGQQRGLARSTE